jgi:hypothetical protein
MQRISLDGKYQMEIVFEAKELLIVMDGSW